MTPRFDDDFKREFVRVAQTSGLSQRQVATDFGIGLSTFGKWLVKYGDQTGLSQAQMDQQKEIAHLRKELRIAQEERGVLKKATEFFAGLRASTPSV